MMMVSNVEEPGEIVYIVFRMFLLKNSLILLHLYHHVLLVVVSTRKLKDKMKLNKQLPMHWNKQKKRCSDNKRKRHVIREKQSSKKWDGMKTDCLIFLIYLRGLLVFSFAFKNHKVVTHSALNIALTFCFTNGLELCHHAKAAKSELHSKNHI